PPADAGPAVPAGALVEVAEVAPGGGPAVAARQPLPIDGAVAVAAAVFAFGPRSRVDPAVSFMVPGGQRIQVQLEVAPAGAGTGNQVSLLPGRHAAALARARQMEPAGGVRLPNHGSALEPDARPGNGAAPVADAPLDLGTARVAKSRRRR